MKYIKHAPGLISELSAAEEKALLAIPEFYTAEDGVPELVGQRRRAEIVTEKDKDVAAYLAAKAVKPVPQAVTMRQGKEALIRKGLDEKVQSAVDAISDATERKIAQNFWNNSNTFERKNATLISLATAIGMADKDLDALFTYAATL